MSIRLKTVLGVALIEGCLLLLLIVMMLNFIRDTNYDNLVKRAQTTATLFATTTQDAVLSYDLASLKSFVEEVIKNPDLVYARVVDSNNRVLAQAGNVRALNDRGFHQDYQVNAVDDGVFDTAAPISVDRTPYGRVEIGLDISSLQEAIQDAQHWSAVIAVIEMLMVATFSLILGSYLVGRLEGLRRAAERISGGDLVTAVNEQGRDEVAVVAKAFNAMMHNLHLAQDEATRYQQQLLSSNQDLERRVLERTDLLQQKNRELESANRSIQEAQVRLLQSEKMASVGQLAAGVAHEVNNPVGYLMSNLRTLKNYCQSFYRYAEVSKALEKDPQFEENECVQDIARVREEEEIDYLLEDIPELLDDSIEGSNRIRQIVAALKEFSYSSDQSPYSYYDLNHCVETTLKMAFHEYKYKASLTTDLQPLPNTWCAPGQINQVLLNLVVNAAQAVDKGGQITVSSRVREGWIEISVDDDGPGIPQENLHKLFDPFFTSKPLGEGTGLGLAISSRIVSEHGGVIDVESEPGHGSCFTVRIPVRGGEDDPSAQEVG